MNNDIIVRAFNTHYEIHNYNLGDNKSLEDDLTHHDWVSYTHTPRYFYDDVRKILYVPRGINDFILKEWYGKDITVVKNETKPHRISFKMSKPPRDDTERKAIRFLAGLDEFSSTKMESQKVLIMPPGYGKTYCAVNAMQRMGLRTMIIVHNTNLKNQWHERLNEYTNLGGINIVDINSSKQLESYSDGNLSENNMVFIVTRRLLLSYIDRYGIQGLHDVVESMGIGLKIFDEAHKEYVATFMIDYATNVKYTFYLTATFALSEYNDNRIFQLAYKNVRKLQITPDEAMKHIIYVAVIFNSRPNEIDKLKVQGKKRGFDRYNYIDYEIGKGRLQEKLRSMINFFKCEKRMDGKMLILSSKKTTCDLFNDLVREELVGIKSCSIYTDNKVDDYKDYECISATPAMLGTGEDIPGLRFMFNTEPGRSLTNTDQFSGRLRPYMNGEKSTYYVEFIDVGFPKILNMYKTRLKLLKNKVKVCYEFNEFAH